MFSLQSFFSLLPSSHPQREAVLSSISQRINETNRKEILRTFLLIFVSQKFKFLGQWFLTWGYSLFREHLAFLIVPTNGFLVGMYRMLLNVLQFTRLASTNRELSIQNIDSAKVEETLEQKNREAQMEYQEFEAAIASPIF